MGRINVASVSPALVGNAWRSYMVYPSGTRADPGTGNHYSFKVEYSLIHIFPEMQPLSADQ